MIDHMICAEFGCRPVEETEADRDARHARVLRRNHVIDAVADAGGASAAAQLDHRVNRRGRGLAERKRAVQGTSLQVRVHICGLSIHKKKKYYNHTLTT